jgi:hypothetical protein
MMQMILKRREDKPKETMASEMKLQSIKENNRSKCKTNHIIKIYKIKKQGNSNRTLQVIHPYL